MEELVLDQAGERLELGEEAAQHAQFVHAAEDPAHLPLAAEHRQHHLAGVLAVEEGPVDVAEAAADQQAEIGGDIDVVLLGQQESPHQAERIGAEEIGVGDVDLSVLQGEDVDFLGLLLEEGPARGHRLDAGDPLRHRIADQVEIVRVPVIVAHERLGPPEDVGLGIVLGVGDAALEFEGQLVVAALAQVMHLAAEAEDEIVGGLDLLALAALEQAGFLEAEGVLDSPLELGDPEEVLIVAEAAAAGLDVRLLDEDGAAQLLVPLFLLGDAPGDVGLRLSLHAFLGKRLFELLPELFVPGEEAALEQGGLGLQVGVGLVDQFGEGAGGVADLEADVPEHVQDLLDHVLDQAVLGLPALGIEEEDIDVAVGIELPAPEAAHRRQDHLRIGPAVGRGDVVERPLPDIAQDHGDQLGPAAADFPPALARAERQLQTVFLDLEEVAIKIEEIGRLALGLGQELPFRVAEDFFEIAEGHVGLRRNPFHRGVSHRKDFRGGRKRKIIVGR